MWFLHATWHVLFAYFAWPWGMVWGNVWAVVPCAIVSGVGLWIGRHRIGKTLVRWLHKHYLVLQAELEQKERDHNV